MAKEWENMDLERDLREWTASPGDSKTRLDVSVMVLAAVQEGRLQGACLRDEVDRAECSLGCRGQAVAWHQDEVVNYQH